MIPRLHCWGIRTQMPGHIEHSGRVRTRRYVDLTVRVAPGAGVTASVRRAGTIVRPVRGHHRASTCTARAPGTAAATRPCFAALRRFCPFRPETSALGTRASSRCDRTWPRLPAAPERLERRNHQDGMAPSRHRSLQNAADAGIRLRYGRRVSARAQAKPPDSAQAQLICSAYHRRPRRCSRRRGLKPPDCRSDARRTISCAAVHVYPSVTRVGRWRCRQDNQSIAENVALRRQANGCRRGISRSGGSRCACASISIGHLARRG